MLSKAMREAVSLKNNHQYQCAKEDGYDKECC